MPDLRDPLVAQNADRQARVKAWPATERLLQMSRQLEVLCELLLLLQRLGVAANAVRGAAKMNEPLTREIVSVIEGDFCMPAFVELRRPIALAIIASGKVLVRHAEPRI